MPNDTNPLDPFGVLGALGGLLGNIPSPTQAFQPLAKLFTIITDRGILIRTATVLGGLALMAIGVFLLFRTPITNAATKAAKAVI